MCMLSASVAVPPKRIKGVRSYLCGGWRVCVCIFSLFVCARIVGCVFVCRCFLVSVISTILNPLPGNGRAPMLML